MKINPSIEQLDLKFGQTREEVEQTLGTPSSKDNIEVAEEAYCESWEYDAQQIELIFDSENGYKLSALTLTSNEVTVDDNEVIDIKEESLLKQFPLLVCDEEKDESGYNYEHPTENLMFWILNGSVQSVTIYE